ncbi:MAG: prephenate dehydrogenase [Elusimicrobia bacterium]|nr:prephenate dehydrogenase [Elusimicrobiota bacterium]
MTKSLGIIGCGRMGKLLAELLRDDFMVKVYDSAVKIQGCGRRVVSSPLSVAASCDIVVFCVPIRALSATLRRSSRHIKKGSLVADICSVKEYPVRLMRDILPSHCEIIGAHPLFGPSSYGDSSALKIVLCPVRIGNPRRIRNYLKNKGFQTIVSTPRRHDRVMARVLNLPQLIGRALAGIEPKSRNLSSSDKNMTTCNYKRLLAIANSAAADSRQLFADIHKYNRFARPMAEKFSGKITGLLDKEYDS